MHGRIEVALAAFVLLPLASARADERLEALVAEALEHNPRILAAQADYEAALENRPQAGALPDPQLVVSQFLRPIETRVGPQSTTIAVTQALPWFGALEDKEILADHGAALLEALYQAHRDETAREVKHAYYEIAYVDRAIETTRDDEALLSHYETLAQARYAQGVGLQQAVVKLQAEITQDRNRIRMFERQRVDAEATLNALRAAPPDEPIDRVTLGPLPGFEHDLEALYTLARGSRSEMEAAALEIAKTEQSLQIAKNDGRPDFTVGAAWTNVLSRRDLAGELLPPEDNGRNALSVSFGLSLPLFRGKYDSEVRQNAHRLAAARSRHDETRIAVESSVRSVAFHIHTLHEQIALFRDALTPQAEQALDSSEAAYSTGTLGVLDLLDSERILLEVRIGQARLEADYMKALADMERALGTTLPETQP